MTSYVLLALLSKPDVSAEDLTLTTQIVSWIIKQQNHSGSFSATQLSKDIQKFWFLVEQEIQISQPLLPSMITMRQMIWPSPNTMPPVV
ncbi:ovostatin-like [Xenopus laevis]|uniref:Ovostatin-like n=1 Tax=Xenopus laevis TaxID=8355 RepID=A0A8J1LDA6_XENLA|nr:ovostatin-like [Xenopus laevis]